MEIFLTSHCVKVTSDSRSKSQFKTRDLVCPCERTNVKERVSKQVEHFFCSVTTEGM